MNSQWRWGGLVCCVSVVSQKRELVLSGVTHNSNVPHVFGSQAVLHDENAQLLRVGALLRLPSVQDRVSCADPGHRGVDRVSGRTWVW